MNKTPIKTVFILLDSVQTQNSQLPTHLQILSKQGHQKEQELTVLIVSQINIRITGK